MNQIKQACLLCRFHQEEKIIHRWTTINRAEPEIIFPLKFLRFVRSEKFQRKYSI